jgi:TolB-like protein/cytochrome c-type biogenesis protein CcmH/NrfG
MASPSPDTGEALAQRAVFLSYAREDVAPAQRIADALASQGVEVWLDQSELRGGDVWDQKIRRQIRGCALFVPIISDRTQARGEGYFRLEWKLAVERTHLMAEGVPFLAPVVVDETPESAAIVPAEFLTVQWIRLPGGLPTPQFVERIRRMLESPGQAVVSAPRTRTGAVRRPAADRTWWVGAAVAVAVAAAAFFISRRPPPLASGPAAAESAAPAEAVDGKSVAVLPFENMSENKDNAFFTDGVHEDVLTDLSFIRDLHVVSRTSVMQYRGTTKSSRQIGRELGVAYVLLGSVRREGNKVRVTGQLIDARTDEQVWAKAYDRDLNDIFAIQGELAQAIAEALQSVLSPETKVLLARRPTENTEAYDDYLKGRQISSLGYIGTEKTARALLEDAVRLDPNFAAAWAELGSLRAFAHFSGDQTEVLLQQAKEAIDSAVRIAPDDPAVIEGLGDYYYYGYRDYPRATEEYMRLEELRPNDAVVYTSLGLIQRRQGRFADALPNLRLGIKLDPTNRGYITAYMESLAGVRHYDELLALNRKVALENPNDLEAAYRLAYNTFFSNGSTAEIKAFLRSNLANAQRAPFVYLQKGATAVTGDWAGYLRLDREERYYDGNPEDPRWSQDVNAAEVFAEKGDMAAARSRAAESMAEMKDALALQPGNADLWAGLSLGHALLGERDEALRCAQKSGELLPESRDAVLGPQNSMTCAFAFMWAGEKARALAELERLLHVPYGANIYAMRVAWRPMHDDPRFKALVGDPKNNAPLL